MKDGSKKTVEFAQRANSNTALQAVGASFGVFKLTNDEPHWSVDGH